MCRTWRRREDDGDAGWGRNVPAKAHTTPFYVTAHAIDRFRERMCPGFSFGQARRELLVLSMSAKRTEDRTRRGAEIWMATDGAALRFIVQRSSASRICVTICLPLEAEELDAVGT